MATKRAKKKANRTKVAGKPVRTARASGATAAYGRYLKIALKLPGTEASTAYGTPSVKVKGKILSRLRTEAEGALALMCDFIDRGVLLQADPNVFFLTDHYRNYPMILVRLDRIRPDALPELVERAWRLRAPAKLIKEHDARRQDEQ
jgi:hypothetical protein